MPQHSSWLQTLGATRYRRARSRAAARFSCAACAVFACVILAPPARAGAGWGGAMLLGANPATAGSTGMWNISYNAQENFAQGSGGAIEVEIPAGWSAPQDTSSSSPGYVAWTDVAKVDSVTIAGRTIRVYLGGGPHADNSTK